MVSYLKVDPISPHCDISLVEWLVNTSLSLHFSAAMVVVLPFFHCTLVTSVSSEGTFASFIHSGSVCYWSFCLCYISLFLMLVGHIPSVHLESFKNSGCRLDIDAY